MPPNNNAFIRMHWGDRSVIADAWYYNVMSERNEMLLGSTSPFPIMQCGIIWRIFVQRRRDWDNAAAMFKVVGDALRKTGTIYNDSPVIVRWFLTEQVKLRKGQAERCEVEIWTSPEMEQLQTIKS